MTTESTTPTIEERYSSAVNTSNLKVDRDSNVRNVADILIAAGWSRARLGTALMRLMSEWDGAEKPRRLSAAAIRVLAQTFANDKPLVLSERGHTEWPHWRAVVQANDWHMHELGMLFQKLKTLPEVRDMLGTFGFLKGIERADVTAAATIAWWLHHTCPSCEGGRYELVPGTGRQSNRICKACRGTGSTRTPHGYDGRALLTEMDAAVNGARSSMGAATRNRY